jgi:predicted amidophosphoribosyltransferase
MEVKILSSEKKNNLKKRHRKPQSSIKSRQERVKNQKNAYKLNYPKKIKDKNIILFDDIYTTGATVNEIKKILKKAGAKNIKIIVLAH